MNSLAYCLCYIGFVHVVYIDLHTVFICIYIHLGICLFLLYWLNVTDQTIDFNVKYFKITFVAVFCTVATVVAIGMEKFVGRSTTLVQTEIFKQILDGPQHHFLHCDLCTFTY